MESIRKAIDLPPWSLETTTAVATGGAFVWLLVQGAVQPIAVLLLELYLSF